MFARRAQLRSLIFALADLVLTALAFPLAYRCRRWLRPGWNCRRCLRWRQ